MRRSMVFVALGLVAGAHASFEMLLIPDSTGRIQRVDPVSQVGLGSFVAFNGAQGAFAISQQEVFVSSTSSNSVFDIGTGMQTRAITTSDFASTVISNGTVLHSLNSNGTQTRTYNLSTQITGGTSGPAGVTMVELVNRGLATSIVYGIDASNRLVTYTMNSSGAASGAPTLTGISYATTTTFSIGGIVDWSGRDYFALRNGTNLNIAYGSGTSYTVAAANYNSLFAAGITPGFVAGHQNLYLVGASSNAGRTRIVRFGVVPFSSFPVDLSNFEVNVTPAANMSAGIVVAPEPGTMAALGLGLAAILRRKKSRSA